MRVSLLATLLALATAAHAHGENDLTLSDDQLERPTHRSLQIPLVIAESVAILIPPTLYYYATTDLQREDFELRWDWASWKTKLTSFDAVVFDTGNWQSNAFRHPLSGALSYQAARANGFEAIGATLIDFSASVVWEYVVEYREKVSLNDISVNTLSGFSIGEPMFQLGRIAMQPDASLARKLLGFVASPIDRLHHLASYGAWHREPAPWTRFELGLTGGLANHGPASRPEAGLELDLELIRQPRYGAPGRPARPRPAMFNRVAAALRFDESGISNVEFHSSTTYGGRYRRSIDDAGDGTDLFLGAAAGFDYQTRRLREERDQLAVFHVIGPRVSWRWWRGPNRMTWEVGGSGDAGMVRAHVFGPVLPFEPMPQTSVLQTRGYYFAAGLSLSTRLRLDLGRWTGQLEGRAHQLWSIDGRDRFEMGGGIDDPHDLSDLRATGLAVIGYRPGGGDLRVDASLEGSVRRGAWESMTRVSNEVVTGARVVVPF